jgi:lambda family phage portal protein
MTKPHVRLKSTLEAEVPRAGAVAHQAASIISRDLAGWVPRRQSSADADLLQELGPIRDRARDADRNNGLARGGVNTILDNVVGTGLRLSARPNYLALGKDKQWAVEWAQQMEGMFHAWWWSTACHAGDTLNGDQLIEQAQRAELMNGDALALPLWLPDRGDGYATKLQMVESDRLSNPENAPDSTRLRAGVATDGVGMPLGYWIRNTHPGDSWQITELSLPKWEFVPRRVPGINRLRVIHYFNQERSGQSRGKPILTAVLANFKQLDRYIQAEIMAAVVNGMVAGTIETPLDQDGILELFSRDKAAYMKARDESAVRMESGTLVPLFPGDKLTPFMPQRPASSFGAFVENVGRIIAVGGFDVPYELLFKDFTKTSYSSARASMLEAWRSFNRRRDRLGTGFMDPVYGLFAEEMVNAGKIEAPGFYENRTAYLRCRWIGPGKGWVDPVREAQAAQIRIDTNLSTLEDECAEQGRDWRETLDQQQTEMLERKARGLPDHSQTRAGNPVPTNYQTAPGDPNGPQNQPAGDQQPAQQQSGAA